MNRIAKLLAAAAMIASAPAAAQNAVGDWSGLLIAGEVSLRVVVHIEHAPDGALAGRLDSPDQGAFGITLGEVAAGEGGTLTFTVPVIGGRYSGTWNEAEQRWEGTWNQGAGATPLNLSTAPPPPPLPADWDMPADARIGELIAERIAARAGQGMVVGVLDGGASRIVAGGPQGSAPFDGASMFEIGSISKVFTALILADMANKGEVSLDDPAAKYLPQGHRMPQRGSRPITLRDLSTHMSGLPRLPVNLPMTDPDDPYADYTEAQLLEFLDGYEIPRDVGERHEYSNLGVGLLGYLLGRAAGTDYETLLRQRITGPLGMADTMVTLPPSHTARLVPAFDIYMRPAKPWHLPTLVGAGGIRSTADDMLKFAAAVLDPQSPIAAAMKTTLAAADKTDDARVEQALGWQVFHPEPGRSIVTHGGGTGGFRTQLVIEPEKNRAVVALTNSAAEPSTGDIAMNVLAGSPVAPTPPVPPAPPPVAARTEITLPAAQLDRFVGSYEFAPGVIFTVTRDGNGLRAQRVGSVTGPDLPIFAEAPLSFFWKAVNAQIRFTADESGTITAAEFTQDGQTMAGKRLAP